MGRIFAFKNSWPKHATNIFGRVKYMYLNLNKIFIACFGHEICLKANFLPGFIQVLFITSCTTDTVFTSFIFVGYIACRLMMKYFVKIFRPRKRFFFSEFYLFLTYLAWTHKKILLLCYGIRKLFLESVPNYSIENMECKLNIITIF